MRIEFWMQLDGRGEVRVEAEMSPPEPDVGIDGWFPVGFSVFNAVGDDITDQLIAAQTDAVGTKCSFIAEDRAPYSEAVSP